MLLHLAGVLNGYDIAINHYFCILVLYVSVITFGYIFTQHFYRFKPTFSFLIILLTALNNTKVRMISVNDGLILGNHIPRILKRHFKRKPSFVELLDLFNEVKFQIVSDQMIDLIITHVERKINPNTHCGSCTTYVRLESGKSSSINLEAHPSAAVQSLLKSFLAKIYQRQKTIFYLNFNWFRHGDWTQIQNLYMSKKVAVMMHYTQVFLSI
ncbi:hypothetical protein M9H77_16310 [Catharanthus roseus]|uniref:Uncharacterized protein n=1 Tax=Catharanthus roseus TaxID=4058 RepID=A0ACC0B1H0_CATRO|nr:hypothetical protein M9H77_16310 [Catharanthus roseus]